MNPKIFVFVAVLALAGILGGILLVGPTMTAPGQGNNDTATTEIYTRSIVGSVRCV